MAGQKMISFRLPPETVDAIDRAAGSTGRSKWIRETLELRLASDQPSPIAVAEKQVIAAKAQASVPPSDAAGDGAKGLDAEPESEGRDSSPLDLTDPQTMGRLKNELRQEHGWGARDNKSLKAEIHRRADAGLLAVEAKGLPIQKGAR